MEMAQWFGVSTQAIDGWINRGCPYVQRGRPGVGWVFDLRDVAEWYFARKSAVAAGEDGKPDPESMSPRERRDYYLGNMERRKDAIDAGDVIWKSEAQAAMAETIKITMLSLETLTERVGRKVRLSAGESTEIEAEIDDMRRALYSRLRTAAEQSNTGEPAT